MVEVQDVELQNMEVQKRSGAKRGGGNAVAKRFEKPAKIYEDGGLLFTNGSMQRMLNGEELYINRSIKNVISRLYQAFERRYK